MNDIKKNNQPQVSDTSNNNDYQKILDEAAASIKPEDTDPNIPTSTEDEPVVKLEDVEHNQEKPQLKDINSLQLESPDITPLPSDLPNNPSLLPNDEIIVSSTPDSNQDSKIEPPTETKEENIPVDASTKTETPASKELPKTPEEIKAQIDKIFSDESNQQNSSTNPTKKSNGFRNIFIIALIIFFAVVGAWVYFLFFRQTPNKSTSNTPTPSPIPTEIISNETCELNGVTYKVGESFESADGCNTCSCQTGNNIACTEMACNVTPEVIQATKSAATKITVTPTKPATTSSIPKDWKTYTNPSYNYSFQYPSNWSVKQGSSSVVGESETIKNMSIDLIDNKNVIIMNINIDNVIKEGNISLEKFASQITPLDKVSISQVTSYKIGDLTGLKEMVTFSEEVPGIQSGLRYFTKNGKYFITFSTAENQSSSNISNILSSFKFN